MVPLSLVAVAVTVKIYEIEAWIGSEFVIHVVILLVLGRGPVPVAHINDSADDGDSLKYINYHCDADVIDSELIDEIAF